MAGKSLTGKSACKGGMEAYSSGSHMKSKARGKSRSMSLHGEPIIKNTASAQASAMKKAGKK